MACVKNQVAGFFSLLANKKVVEAWSVFYVAFLCLLFVYSFSKDYFATNGGFADMFINYSGGFVRRGLLGQFFLWCHHVGVDPVWTAAAMSLVSFVIVAIYLISQFIKHGYNLCILTVSWFLGGFGVYGLPSMRRDYIIMCAFLLVVWLWKKMSVGRWVVLANVLVCVTILCYEPYALFSIPFSILLTHLRWKSWLKSVAAWTLPVFVFLVCCKYSGGKEIYDAIVASTSEFLPAPGMINFLLRDSAEVMKYHIQCNFLSIAHGVPVVLLSLVSLFCLVYYSVNAIPVFSEDKADFANRRYVLAFLMCAFVVLSPMFVCLSTDYGRTVIYIVLSSYFLFFALGENERSALLPSFVYRMADSLLVLSDRYLRPTRCKVVFIMYFIGSALWMGEAVGGLVKLSEVGHVSCYALMAFNKIFLLFQSL